MITWLIIAVSIAAVFSLFSYFNLFQGVQWRINDTLFRTSKPGSAAEASKDIVIIAIDDESLNQLGQVYTWPRKYHAQVVDNLAQAGARVILFDVLFSEPAVDDGLLAASMENAGNVILPFVHTITPGKSTGTGQDINIQDTILPLDKLSESASATGHAVVFPDKDGTLRRVPLVINNSGQYEPSIALTAISQYLRRPQVIESPVKDNKLVFAGRSVPLDEADCMFLNYSNESGEPLRFREIPYIQVLNGTVTSESLRGKIAIIGATATGISDKFWTPTGRLMNGVELHAVAMQTLLSGRFLQATSPFLDIFIIFALVFLCSFAVIRLKVAWSVPSAILLCVIYYLVSFSMFDRGTVMNFLYPPLAAIGSFIGTNIYCVINERSEKAEITKVFGHYISQPVAEKILSGLQEGNLRLKGEYQEATMLFADIRNFTHLTENINPEVVFEQLNSYMGAVIGCIQKYGGITNKFGGDSILAVWNAPLEAEEHALLASRAAIEAQQAISRLNENQDNLIPVEFGMGINTGMVMAGNIGSNDRYEYTVIGDAVNVAARLCSAAPGGKIWVGTETFERIKNDIRAEQLGPLTIKGRHEQVSVFELMNYQELPTAHEKELLKIAGQV